MSDARTTVIGWPPKRIDIAYVLRAMTYIELRALAEGLSMGANGRSFDYLKTDDWANLLADWAMEYTEDEK